jgi:putative membrane protein (TIGR04086 family)
MNMKKLIWSTVAASVFLAAANAYLFPKIFPQGFAGMLINTRVSELPQYGLIALVVMSMLMSGIYALSFKGSSSWQEGLKFGALMSLFFALPEILQSNALIDNPSLAQFVPILWMAMLCGIAGIIIALVYSRILR